jgi:hypothetical protein
VSIVYEVVVAPDTNVELQEYEQLVNSNDFLLWTATRAQMLDTGHALGEGAPEEVKKALTPLLGEKRAVSKADRVHDRFWLQFLVDSEDVAWTATYDEKTKQVVALKMAP